MNYGDWFLLVMILGAVIAAVVEPSFIGNLYTVVGRVALPLALAYVLTYVVNRWGRRVDLSKVDGWMGDWIAILGGIISTGPIYAWYPMLADMKEKGLGTDKVASFLYARAVKLPLIPVMVAYFGWPFVVVLTVIQILFAWICGKIVKEVVG